MVRLLEQESGMTPPKALPHVLTGLIAKRREIAGRIEDLQRQLKLAVNDLDHIESSIRIFQPDIDLTEYGPRPVPPPHAAFRGEVSRILLESLRKADMPLSTADLTRVLMAERGLPHDDLKARKTILRRVSAALINWRHRGIVKSSPGPGQMLNWNIVR
jgi:hypothetical protein